jgi:hypothetical protein
MIWPKTNKRLAALGKSLALVTALNFEPSQLGKSTYFA